jgi:hypothetical protein
MGNYGGQAMASITIEVNHSSPIAMSYIVDTANSLGGTFLLIQIPAGIIGNIDGDPAA